IFFQGCCGAMVKLDLPLKILIDFTYFLCSRLDERFEILPMLLQFSFCLLAFLDFGSQAFIQILGQVPGSGHPLDQSSISEPTEICVAQHPVNPKAKDGHYDGEYEKQCSHRLRDTSSRTQKDDRKRKYDRRSVESKGKRKMSKYGGCSSHHTSKDEDQENLVGYLVLRKKENPRCAPYDRRKEYHPVELVNPRSSLVDRNVRLSIQHPVDEADTHNQRQAGIPEQ